MARPLLGGQEGQEAGVDEPQGEGAEAPPARAANRPAPTSPAATRRARGPAGPGPVEGGGCGESSHAFSTPETTRRAARTLRGAAAITVA